MNRADALHQVAALPDVVERFGLTRQDVLEEISRQAVKAISHQSGGDLLDRVTISLADAGRFLHLTRREIIRNAEIINHGKRNQVITLREFDRLKSSRTETPKNR